MSKRRRQTAILDLVAREAITSQEQLRRRLRGAGLDATQATLSRDIKELALVKRAVDGAYRPAADEANPAASMAVFERAVSEYATGMAQAQQLIVIRTGPGLAQPLGSAIDRAVVPDIVGTVGGDDTLIVIARTPRRARALLRRFEELTRRP